LMLLFLSASEKAQAFTCGTDTVAGVGGITYGTVLAPDGNCWLDRNLGAPNVASSYNDSANYGYLYQWGRGNDGHQLTNSGTTATLSTTDTPGHANFITSSASPDDWRNPQSDTLWQGVSGINNPCPTGFRLPTQTEWATVFVASPEITNYTTAASSVLHLPAAGKRVYDDGTLNLQGSVGFYWSSAPFSVGAYLLFFNSDSVAFIYYNNRAFGFSVRCIKDNTPTGTSESETPTLDATVTETMTLVCDNATIPAVTAGVAQSTQAACTATTNGATGFNLKVRTNTASADATKTLLHTDTSTWIINTDSGLSAYTELPASTALWTAGNTKGLGFRVRSVSGGTTRTNTVTDWGTDETDGNAKYAAFPITDKTIYNYASYAGSASVVNIDYKLDVSAGQKAGSYTGTVLYTATTN